MDPSLRDPHLSALLARVPRLPKVSSVQHRRMQISLIWGDFCPPLRFPLWRTTSPRIPSGDPCLFRPFFFKGGVGGGGGKEFHSTKAAAGVLGRGGRTKSRGRCWGGRQEERRLRAGQEARAPREREGPDFSGVLRRLPPAPRRRGRASLLPARHWAHPPPSPTPTRPPSVPESRRTPPPPSPVPRASPRGAPRSAAPSPSLHRPFPLAEAGKARGGRPEAEAAAAPSGLGGGRGAGGKSLPLRGRLAR